MKIARLSNMLWVPARTVNEREIKNAATFTTVNEFDNSQTKIRLWQINHFDDERWIGVPRMWGVTQRWFNHDVMDDTVDPTIGWPNIVIDTYWEGQEESVNAIAAKFRGGSRGALLEAPCGSGKTLMSLAVAAQLHTPTLVVVHKEDLAWQWHRTLKACFPGASVGHCQQDKWNYKDKHLVTATAQTLYARRKTIKKDFLTQFGLVIYDEGHRYSAKTFEQVLKMFPCYRRLAVSATWRRKDGLDFIWRWHVGDIEWTTSTDRPTGEYIQVDRATVLTDRQFIKYGRIRHTDWITAIAENQSYNQWLCDQSVRASHKGRRILCVSDRVQQLVDLKDLIESKAPEVSVGLYCGSVAGKRMTKTQLEESKECDIILATYGMMNEGTDIPALDTLFVCTPRADVEQVVGRIQRKKEGKKNLLVVDPVFQTPYCRALARKRRTIYEKLRFVGVQNGKAKAK